MPKKKNQSFLSSILKHERKIEKEAKTLEKPFWDYGSREWLYLSTALAFIFTLIIKYFNIVQWMETEFNMISYSPNTFFLQIFNTMAWFAIGFFRKDAYLVSVGIFNMIYTGIFAYGMILTYKAALLPF